MRWWCHADHIGTNGYCNDNYCIDAVAAYDDDCDAFQCEVVSQHGCYGVIAADADCGNVAGVVSVAMVNCDHCVANEMHAAFQLDDGDDKANDLAMLQATLVEYALQIGPFQLFTHQSTIKNTN